MGVLYPQQTNYLFANLLFFASREGDEAASPSFATRYTEIEASSAFLEALIATLLPAGGTAKVVTFMMAIKLLIAVESLFSCTDGDWVTKSSCATIGACNELL